MANRHRHEKLRAETLARMTKTGESYQAARQRILMRTNERRADVDLVPFRFFGVPLTLATVRGPIAHSVAVLSVTPKSNRTYPLPLRAWLLPRGVN